MGTPFMAVGGVGDGAILVKVTVADADAMVGVIEIERALLAGKARSRGSACVTLKPANQTTQANTHSPKMQIVLRTSLIDTSLPSKEISRATIACRLSDCSIDLIGDRQDSILQILSILSKFRISDNV